MPSYKKYLIVLFLLIGSISYANNKKTFPKEDLYIVFALEYEQLGYTENARELYLKLFNQSKKYEYLVNYLKLSTRLRKFSDVIKYASKNLNPKQKDYEVVLRMYTIALLNEKQYTKALKYGKKLIHEFDNAINYDVVANIYFLKKDYKNSKKYFESAYILSKNPTSLFNLVNVLYAYLNKKEEAIAYLETHIRLYGCDYLVCTKLLSFYQEQNNVDGAISILKKSYFTFKKKGNTEYANKVYDLLIAYLEKEDIKQAIEFLEKNHIDDLKLLSLYRRDNQIQKALMLIQKLYNNNGNIELLAQMAILEFEAAKDKRKVLPSVIKKFEDVLTVLNSHLYQNYLGYILIDYDVDVKRGLSLVNQALKQAPNNIAYLDSQAWGYYKLDECKKAYKIMKKVVDAVGLSDHEIISHWKQIKECKKK